METTLKRRNLENWMTLLPAPVRSKPLIHLAIPGTHDSMTYAITHASGLSPDAESLLQMLRFLGPLLRVIMCRWSRTQEFSVSAQLRNGIRYFDLRLASKRGSDELFFVHGLYSCEVGEVLREVRGFLDEHPKEVVILDCQHFYRFGLSDHEKLMRGLLGTFAGKLVPYSHDLRKISLQSLETFKLQVFVVYRSDCARFGQPLLWPSLSFPSPWPETVSIKRLFKSLDESLGKRPKNCGFISQCVLTPTTWYVARHLFSTLKLKCVIPLEERKYEWIQRQKCGQNGVNVIISDFVEVDNCRFCHDVINLNYFHAGSYK